MECVPLNLRPRKIFACFCESISWDDSVLLDLLISPETCFLLYFTKYLRFIINSRLTDNVTIELQSTMSSSGNITNPTKGAYISKEKMTGHQHSRNLTGTTNNQASSCAKSKLQSLVQYDISSSDDDADEVAERNNKLSLHYNTPLKEMISKNKQINQLEEVSLNEIMPLKTILYSLMVKLKQLNSQNLSPFNCKPLISLLQRIDSMFFAHCS